MRGLKSTIALFLVLAGLGAYIYFVTWKQTDDDSATKQDTVFAGVEADKIEELKIKSESGEVTTLKKAADKWQIVAPVDGAGRRIPKSWPDERARPAGDRPRHRREAGRSQGVRPRRAAHRGRVQVGRRQAVGTAAGRRQDADRRRAVREAQRRAARVPHRRTTRRGRSTSRRSICATSRSIKFERDKVDGVEVNAGGKPIQFAKEGSDWKITKPLAARADFSAVEGLVGRVESAQMKSIVTEQATPADLKKFGLDKPLGHGHAEPGQRARRRWRSAEPSGRRRLRTRRVEAARRHRRQVARRRPEEDRRRLPAEGRVRVPRVQRDSSVEFTRGSQTVAFERVKGTGRKRRRLLEARQPERRRCRQEQGRGAARRARRHPGHLLHRLDRQDRPRQAGDDGRRQVRGRQEGRARELRQERQRRLRR